MEHFRTKKTLVRSGIILVSLLVLLGVSGGVSLAFTPAGWFRTVDLDVNLTREEKESLLDYAFSKLSSGDVLERSLKDFPADDARRVLFLSSSNGESPAVIGIGEGKGYRKALDAAIAALTEKPERPLWVKIDVLDAIQLRCNEPLTEPVAIQTGIEGFAFRECPACTFFAEIVVTKGIIGDNGFLSGETFVREGGPRAREFFRQLLDAQAADRMDFRTTSFIKDENGFREVSRGRQDGDLSARDLMGLSKRAARYLSGMVKPSGRFVYRYDPLEDRKLGGYNILRHAGTLYSMLEYHRVADESEVFESARRALVYLLDHIHTIERDGVTMACVVEDGEVKLGGNGLGALAIAMYIEVTGEREYLPVLQKLCEWMIHVQDRSGRFLVHKEDFPDGPVSEFRSSYYPGEAIFGLMRTFEIDGDTRWLEAADAAARYLITVRDRGLRAVQLPHDHWLLYGLNELYRQKEDPLFANHAFRIAGAIMGAQNRNLAAAEWNGGFGFHPRSTPAATRMEGLGAAYRIALAAGNRKQQEALIESLQLGNAFLLRTVIDPSWAMYMKNPARAVGGVRKSLDDFEVRIDYVQHSLSAFLSMAAILEK
ncbi:MAG: hypothetical protein ACP5DY_06990 [Thermovirgaceae bacterium]